MIPNALYPMGPVTFAIACSFCKNIGSDKCVRCKCEIESGFELKDRHQMTNADRIRAMSDEELCDLLDEWWCMGANNDERLAYADERLAWLQQLAGEEKEGADNG